MRPTSGSTRTTKVLAISAGSLLSVLASVIFWMVAARWLSKHDYATIRQTFLAYDFAAPLLTMGLPAALYYWLPREQDRRGVVIDNVAALAATGLVFSLFIALGGYRVLAARFNNPDLLRTIPWLVPYPLLVLPVAGVAAVLVFANRTKTLAVYNVVLSVTTTVAGIAAVVTTKSYSAPILVRVVVPAIFLPLAIGLMLSAAPGASRRPSPTRMRAMAIYSFPLGVATMLGTLTLQLHSIIVAAMTSPQQFAVYVNGAIEIPVIGVVTGSLTLVVFAEMSDLCARGELTAALALFRTAAIKSACALFPTMCFLLACAVPFITLLYSDSYIDSVAPFMVFLLVLPARIVVYGAALTALGMSRAILLRSMVDLAINAALGYMLVRSIGYIGAAIAAVVTLYFWTIPFNLRMIAQGFGVRWQETLPLGSLLRILSISVLCAPLAVLGARLVSGFSLGQLVIAALLYWPAVAYSLYRAGFIAPPAWFDRLIPTGLRVA